MKIKDKYPEAYLELKLIHDGLTRGLERCRMEKHKNMREVFHGVWLRNDITSIKEVFEPIFKTII